MNRWGTYGRRPLVLLALVAFVDAVDRGVLPGALSGIQDDLGFSDTQAGLIGTAYVVAGVLVTMPAGYVADRARRGRIIAIVLASWGVVSMVTASVQSLWQFIAIRSVLGIAETIDNPASQSMIADYYPSASRGRAYAIHRVAPLIGTAVGTGIGGAVSAALSWRWAFLLVGAPGSLLAIAIWRLPEPARGAHDEQRVARDRTTLRRDIRDLVRIRALRALMIGTAIGSGALVGIGYWGPEFFERHTSLEEDQAAGVVGVLILLGALAGTLTGGLLRDRLARRHRGSAMLLAGVTQAIGAMGLIVVFLPVPLAVRLVMSVVGVMFVVAGFPALSAMTADIVDGARRGLAFALTGFASTFTGAISPLLIGFIANRFEFSVDGTTTGNLANAFLIVTPLVFAGAFVLVRGRRALGEPA